MLSVTEQASRIIRELIGKAQLPEGAGLRLAQRDHHAALAMTLCEQPATDDVVLLDQDVRVFLGPVAADRTQDQALDAEHTETHTAFYLQGAAGTRW